MLTPFAIYHSEILKSTMDSVRPGRSRNLALCTYRPQHTLSSSNRPRQRQLSLTTQLAPPKQQQVVGHEVSPNPESFYRQHRRDYSNSTGAALNQNSLVVQHVDQTTGTTSTHCPKPAIPTPVAQMAILHRRIKKAKPPHNVSEHHFTPSTLYASSKLKSEHFIPSCAVEKLHSKTLWPNSMLQTRQTSRQSLE